EKKKDEKIEDERKWKTKEKTKEMRVKNEGEMKEMRKNKKRKEKKKMQEKRKSKKKKDKKKKDDERNERNEKKNKKEERRRNRKNEKKRKTEETRGISRGKRKEQKKRESINTKLVLNILAHRQRCEVELIEQRQLYSQEFLAQPQFETEELQQQNNRNTTVSRNHRTSNIHLRNIALNFSEDASNYPVLHKINITNIKTYNHCDALKLPIETNAIPNSNLNQTTIQTLTAMLNQLNSETQTQAIPDNEIQNFVEARWVSAPEAVWRILKFKMNGMNPAVTYLQVHLPNQQ
ncbi:5849_t:CDS:2, partial [Racocetra fulgida]